MAIGHPCARCRSRNGVDVSLRGLLDLSVVADSGDVGVARDLPLHLAQSLAHAGGVEQVAGVVEDTDRLDRITNE
jgi:hypothetical protein